MITYIYGYLYTYICLYLNYQIPSLIHCRIQLKLHTSVKDSHIWNQAHRASCYYASTEDLLYYHSWHRYYLEINCILGECQVENVFFYFYVFYIVVLV